MKQVFLNNNINNMATSATAQFNTITGGSGNRAWTTTENRYQVPVPTSGTFRNLRVTINGTPGGAASYAFTVRKNGGDTSVTGTITSGITTISDNSNSFTVVAGDTVDIKVVASSTPTARAATWSIEFEGDTANYNFIGGSNYTFAATNSATRYEVISGGNTQTTTDALAASVVPHGATVKAMYFSLNVSPGAGKNWKYQIMKNGSNEASSEVTVADAATTGNVTGLSIALTAGDRISLRTVPTGTPTSGQCCWSVLFESTTDGESMLIGRVNNGINSADHYAAISGREENTGTEASTDSIVGGTNFDLKNLYVNLSAAPGSGTNWDTYIRKNAGSTAVVATVNGTNTTGSDITNTASFTNGDLVNLLVDAIGSPSSSSVVRFGMTQYIAPGGATSLIKTFIGVTQATIKSVSSVTNATMKKLAGVANT